MSQRERNPKAEGGPEPEVPTNILLIDDDEHFRRFVERFLRQQGFYITSAGSGQEGLVHWSTDPNWNAERNPNSIGWVRTDETREVEQTPAVTEVVWVVDVEAQEAVAPVAPTYRTETRWSSTKPGNDWSATGAEKTVVISGVEQQLLPQGETPGEDGWYQTGNTVEGRTNTENLWAAAHPGGDWVATGQERPGATVTETTQAHSAPAPGQGWTKLADSEITVVDEAEKKVKVKDAWTEQKMVKGPWAEQVKVADEIPAGPECADDETPVVTPPVIEPVDETPVVPTAPIVLGEEAVVEEDDESVEEKDDQKSGDDTTTTPAVLGVEATTADTTDAPVAVPTSVDAGLGTAVATPAQGSDWRQAAGLFALAAGIALYTVPMRRRAEVR